MWCGATCTYVPAPSPLPCCHPSSAPISLWNPTRPAPSAAHACVRVTHPCNPVLLSTGSRPCQLPPAAPGCSSPHPLNSDRLCMAHPPLQSRRHQEVPVCVCSATPPEAKAPGKAYMCPLRAVATCTRVQGVGAIPRDARTDDVHALAQQQVVHVDWLARPKRPEPRHQHVRALGDGLGRRPGQPTLCDTSHLSSSQEHMHGHHGHHCLGSGRDPRLLVPARLWPGA